MVALALKLTKCARRTRHENVLSRVDAEAAARVGAAELECTPTAAAPSAATSRPRIQMPRRRCMRRSYALHGHLNRARLQFARTYGGDLASTWSIHPDELQAEVAGWPRKSTGKTQVRRTISHSLPRET